MYEQQQELVGIEENHYEFGHDFLRVEGYLQGRYDPLPFLSGALGPSVGLSGFDRATLHSAEGKFKLCSAERFQPPTSRMDIMNRARNRTRYYRRTGILGWNQASHGTISWN